MLALDPIIGRLTADAPMRPLDASTLAARRAASLGALGPSQWVRREEHDIPDAPGVSVRVYRPEGVDGVLPCVFSIHGGWYVIGSAAMDDDRLSRWARRFHSVGVSVEYRLAPECPYPGPLEDCYVALQWVIAHHDELGIDPTAIGVAGTSAGAGLAAALALLCRDRGEISLRFQLLDAPMLDDRQDTISSRREGLVVYNRESCAFGWRSYLGSLYGARDLPPYAAPGRAADLRGLPAAYLTVGDLDGFRDEAMDYATRLGDADVPTELHVHPGAPHGVKGFVDAPVAVRYAAGIDDWIGRQLAAAQ